MSHSPPPSPRDLPWWLPPAFAFLAALLSRWALSVYLFHSGQMPLGISRESPRLLKYDAIWHWYIAHHGYEKVDGPLQYADLITHYSWTWPKLLSSVLVLGPNSLFAGIVLNCLIFALAAAVLARLVTVCGLVWWKPVALLCCYPTSFFANTIYNEPIFLLLTFSSMLLLVTNRPFLAFFMDAGALTIRVNAWASVAATVFASLRARMRPRLLVIGGLVLLGGALAQPLAVWKYRGSPTAHWNDLREVYWMANPQPIPFKDHYRILSRTWRGEPAEHFNGCVDYSTYHEILPSLSLVAALILLLVGWKMLPAVVRVQGLATIGGLSLLEQAISTPRYLMAFIPMYFLAARCPGWLLGPICALMVWSQMHLVSRFIRHAWAF